jgi:DNA-3-methyladenine glycosylase II
MTTFSIPVIQPYPWDTVLRYLSSRCTPVIETVDAVRYCRGPLTVQARGGVLAVSGVKDPDTELRLRRLFDTDHDPATAAKVLARCRLMRPRLAQMPGARVPGCWDPFELGLRVILGQQVSVKAAHTLMGRLVARCPGLTPGAVARADLAHFGMPSRRVATLQQFAGRVVEGAIDFALPWPAVAAQIAEVPGIGPWTLQYLAIRLGRDPDAFPDSDLGLLHAAGAATPGELRKLAERWRPYRAYAAMYLWNTGPL